LHSASRAVVRLERAGLLIRHARVRGGSNGPHHDRLSLVMPPTKVNDAPATLSLLPEADLARLALRRVC
jgi:hypothetical protein